MKLHKDRLQGKETARVKATFKTEHLFECHFDMLRKTDTLQFQDVLEDTYGFSTTCTQCKELQEDSSTVGSDNTCWQTLILFIITPNDHSYYYLSTFSTATASPWSQKQIRTLRHYIIFTAPVTAFLVNLVASCKAANSCARQTSMFFVSLRLREQMLPSSQSLTTGVLLTAVSQLP